MNTVLYRSSEKMPFHTFLGPIFKAFEGRQKEFNWLIKNFECNHLPTIVDWRDKEMIWVTGEELTRIIDDDDIQFIWGDLFGFRKDIELESVMNNFRPYSKQTDPIHSENPQIQHLLATFQIICFDSGYTVLLSKDNDLSQRFRNYFKEAQDLKEWKKNF